MPVCRCLSATQALQQHVLLSSDAELVHTTAAVVTSAVAAAACVQEKEVTRSKEEALQMIQVIASVTARHGTAESLHSCISYRAVVGTGVEYTLCLVVWMQTLLHHQEQHI